MYTYEEAYQDSLEYFNNDELAAKVFLDKYALRDKENNILENTPEKTHRRLAKEFARIEAQKFENPLTEDEIFSYFDKFKAIIPQGSPIFAIGNDIQTVSISNCFVVESPEDSYGGICKTDQELAQISKRRGGVGVDLSKLRPNGARTNNSSRSSTGIKTWMQRYSNTIREVGQSGRRGALMETISIHHPDIETFITAKNNDTDVTGANISVRLSDEFLEAVRQDTEYELRFPVDSDNVVKTLNARKVWEMIVHNAWLRAEPGILFWDNILRESIPDCYEDFKTISTNPCGEITLSANDSCRLMAINLTYFVRNHFTKDAYFDFNELYRIGQIAQRLMDDMIDLELEKIKSIINKIKQDPENKDIKDTELSLWKKMYRACEDGRRTGLGITGLGDAVAFCNYNYGTDESIKFIERIYKTLKFSSYRASVDCSKELGSFPVWDWEKEKENPFINRIKDESLVLDGAEISGRSLFNQIKKHGRRNIANLTTAPTGSISILASLNFKEYHGTTSGIEPVYTWRLYTRKKKGNPGDNNFRSDFVDQNGDHWMEFKIGHKGVQAWIELYGEEDLEKDCPYVGSSAEEIIWTQRVKLQAAAQKHVDHSISSTVNLPNNISEEEVNKIYEIAWKSGCKGITVYRDGCRTGVLVKDKEEKPNIKTVNAPKRPKTLPCDIHTLSVKGQKFTVIVGLMNNKPYEVFCIEEYIDKHKEGKITKTGKGTYSIETEDGKFALSKYLEDDTENALLRLISTCLRHGAEIQFVIEQLQKTKGDFVSFNKSIARTLKKYIEEGKQSSEVCSCGDKLYYQEGCLTCKSCGFSKCN